MTMSTGRLSQYGDYEEQTPQATKKEKAAIAIRRGCESDG
jgi:hypothetical protein